LTVQLLDRPAVNSASELIGAVEALGYRSSITMPLEAVNAIEAQYGRARMLDHALASKEGLTSGPRR